MVGRRRAYDGGDADADAGGGGERLMEQDPNCGSQRASQPRAAGVTSERRRSGQRLIDAAIVDR